MNSLASLTELDCSGNEIANLNVNLVPNLTKLICNNNKIVDLNISNSTSLKIIECNYNQLLVSVNLSNLPNLEDFSVAGFYNNRLLSIMNLQGLPQLKNLVCINGLLTTLNLSNLTGLQFLQCNDNKLTSLILNNLPNLTYLFCTGNPISSLDVSMLTNLEDLICGIGNSDPQSLTGQLSNVNVAGLSHLKRLVVQDHILTNLDLTGVNNLETLLIYGTIGTQGGITSIDLSNCSLLKTLRFQGNKLTSLNVSNSPLLEFLDCSYNKIVNLNLTGLVNLKELHYSNNLLTNMNLVNLPILENLDCSYNNLNSLNILNLTNLKTLRCSTNQLTTLNLSGLNNLEELDYSDNQLTFSNVSGLSQNLKSLGCGSNNLTSLDISGLTNLETLSCYSNQLTNLDLSSLVNLKSLNCASNLLSNLQVTNLIKLQTLACRSNQLTNLDISGLNFLSLLSVNDNLLTSLDLNNHAALTFLEYENNAIPNLNVSSLINLTSLNCRGSQSSIVDTSNLKFLQNLFCDNNQMATLDLNNNKNLIGVTCSNNPSLQTLFLKNGQNENFIELSNNLNLKYICADTSQLYSLQTQLNSLGMNATVSNSYCTFDLGGNHNDITGITIFDSDNNGCDVTDEVNPFIRLDINDGTNIGSTVTNINGTYNFYTNAGNYTITPNVENPTWFDFSPPSANFAFVDNNNNLATQNFCIAALGTHSDVEVVFAPVLFARPGFDAEYKIVYKNKGNQMLSGAVNLNFNDSLTDLVVANPAPNTTALNSLTWNYINLMPFENRSISVILNVNSPVETPDVNIGDILNFSTTINPIGSDDNPTDNTFNYDQIVVGSFDPNDITCIEGPTVDPSQIGKYLHYVINFENTGNFPAENIVVKDIIDENIFDVSSLQVMNSSSAVTARITGNVAEFIFKNINLEGGGHGNILIKIKTKPTIQVGNIASKNADIFFDYNAPVNTGIVNTIFQSLSSTIFNLDKSISVSPNPATSIVNINSINAIKNIQLYDVQGRLLQTKLSNESNTKIDITDKTNGVYFLKITTEQGSKIEKIIKE